MLLAKVVLSWCFAETFNTYIYRVFENWFFFICEVLLRHCKLSKPDVSNAEVHLKGLKRKVGFTRSHPKLKKEKKINFSHVELGSVDTSDRFYLSCRVLACTISWYNLNRSFWMSVTVPPNCNRLTLLIIIHNQYTIGIKVHPYSLVLYNQRLKRLNMLQIGKSWKCSIRVEVAM